MVKREQGIVILNWDAWVWGGIVLCNAAFFICLLNLCYLEWMNEYIYTIGKHANILLFNNI